MSQIPPSIRMPATTADDEQIASMARAAWLKRGWLCIRVDEVVDAWKRQTLINIATERYGPRAAVHGEREGKCCT